MSNTPPILALCAARPQRGAGPYHLTKYTVSKLADRILVEIVVDWKGGVLGGRYMTTVVWEIGEHGHIQARVTLDSALTSVEQKNKDMLNDYFCVRRSMTDTIPE
jgi:hypothetical protein